MQPSGDWHSSAYQFNQALVGVDVYIGAGNAGAVGIDMNAAQGSTLEHVSVYAPPDAAAGVAGGNGGGGSYKAVHVVGARIGFDMRETGSSPTCARRLGHCEDIFVPCLSIPSPVFCRG